MGTRTYGTDTLRHDNPEHGLALEDIRDHVEGINRDEGVEAELDWELWEQEISDLRIGESRAIGCAIVHRLS